MNKLTYSLIIVGLLSTTACAKKEKYLSEKEAIDYIRNGYSLICKKRDENILINKNVVFVSHMAGMYMFTSNYNPRYAGISTSKCKRVE